MKIHYTSILPKSFRRSAEYTPCRLDKSYFRKMPNNIVEIWYWYGSGYYCGAGQLLAKDNKNNWYHHDCGHCSCYGPIENLDFSFSGKSSLKKLYDECSTDMKKEIDPLIKMIKSEDIMI